MRNDNFYLNDTRKLNLKWIIFKALCKSMFPAIVPAVVLYVSIWFAYMSLSFSLSLFGLNTLIIVILESVLRTICELLSFFYDVGSGDDLILLFKNVFESSKHYAIQYGIFFCYLLALIGTTMDELGLTRFKIQIINKFKGYFQKVENFLG